MVEISSLPSSTTPNKQKHDVFISFRGPDTRDNILSHLHAAFHGKQIKDFIDNDLARGDDISEALLRTIEQSKISLIFFSENYSSSRWCLDELVHIMKCKEQHEQIVIPVFFKVDPSHVRNQSGHFGQTLARYEGNPKMQIWRDALTKAANLSGWDSKVTRPEATLVEKIVEDVLNKLHCASISDNDGLIGIRSRIQHINSMLNACSEDVRIIGIWGMGGIGKSTLAGAFFNEMFTKFEGYCFLANVREECQKHGLNILRKKLLVEVLKDDNINVATPHLGLVFIRNRLHHIKALIVLDDVDNSNHLEFLVGGHDWFGQGSVIIITCRDKQVLQNTADSIYEIPGLDDIEAHFLFTQHAFKEKHPIDGYHQKLSSKAITYAKGNPLALKILGSHLFGKSEQEQESALMKLKRTPIKGIQQVLLVSYDGLDHEEKKLFLNIAYFFKGEHISRVKWFHDACGCFTDHGIRVLINQSLITIENNHVWMHDLLQEMGRQIVREECIEEPGKRSRLWDHIDISHVLTENTGTKKVMGILLDSHDKTLNIHPAAFKKMCNIEFLKFGFSCNIYLCQGLESLPNKLRYLDWYGYPLRSLPLSYHPENLVTFNMSHSHLRRLWNGRQNLVHLKEIILSGSSKLIEIPDLSLATSLQNLFLTGCTKLENVSVNNNCNLKFLSLRNCPSIKKFPNVPLGIERLDLWGTGIKEVPSSTFNLKSLISLWLGRCKMLIDYNIWFSGVSLLDISGHNFQEIPFAIQQLSNLKLLGVQNCKRLQSLPQLPMNVTRIFAQNCLSLEKVASPLSTSTSYDNGIYFYFSNCPKLDQIPQNSIVADVEWRLLHWAASDWKATNFENFLKKNEVANVSFVRGDVPDWFNYKTSGSSLIAELPQNWCNDELCCFVFGIVVEFMGISMPNVPINYKCHIRNNRGDDYSGNRLFFILSPSEDPIRPNELLLAYNPLFVNDWRKIPKEANDVDEISVEFYVNEAYTGYFTIKGCGIRLLYTYDIEDRYHCSMVQPNSPCGDLTHFSLDQGFVDDEIGDSMIKEVEENACHDDKSYNVDSLVEDLAPAPRKRRKKMKQKANMFKFPKFLRVRRKSTRKVWWKKL